MPRTAGVSSSSTVWLMRRRPRPRTVARWLSRVPTTPRTSVTLTVLPDFFAVTLFLAMILIFFSCRLTQDLFDRLAALRRDLGCGAHALQSVDRGANHVIGIRRTEALGQDVGHAHDFENRPHGSAGDDPGSFRCRLHEHLRRAVMADNGVLERAVFETDLDHLAARLVHGFLHGHRHFPGLALAHADTTIAVAHHGQGRKTKYATALHHLGDAVDRHHLFAHAIAAIFVLLLHSGHGCYVLRTSIRPRALLPQAP